MADATGDNRGSRLRGKERAARDWASKRSRSLKKRGKKRDNEEREYCYTGGRMEVLGRHAGHI